MRGGAVAGMPGATTGLRRQLESHLLRMEPGAGTRVATCCLDAWQSGARPWCRPWNDKEIGYWAGCGCTSSPNPYPSAARSSSVYSPRHFPAAAS
jgi:hypothetical protein